jgi:hypothetical protein
LKETAELIWENSMYQFCRLKEIVLEFGTPPCHLILFESLDKRADHIVEADELLTGGHKAVPDDRLARKIWDIALSNTE